MDALACLQAVSPNMSIIPKIVPGRPRSIKGGVDDCQRTNVMETYSSDMQLTEHHIFGMSDNLPSIKVHVTKGSISSCEHYSRRYDVDHFIYFDITKGLYET